MVCKTKLQEFDKLIKEFLIEIKPCISKTKYTKLKNNISKERAKLIKKGEM